MRKMRAVSLCTGIGGFSLAAVATGLVGQCQTSGCLAN
jgi:site-specific DNA-cytosine methylase